MQDPRHDPTRRDRREPVAAARLWLASEGSFRGGVYLSVEGTTRGGKQAEKIVAPGGALSQQTGPRVCGVFFGIAAGGKLGGGEAISGESIYRGQRERPQALVFSLL